MIMGEGGGIMCSVDFMLQKAWLENVNDDVLNFRIDERD